MDRRADAFGTLGWGLRKYAWLPIVVFLAVAALVPVLAARAANVYEARALVTADRIVITNLNVLPRYAASVFNSGLVAARVRRLLDLPPSAAVIPSRVELTTEQDNIAFPITGRSSDPRMAVRLANVAASQFQLELNKTSEGVAAFRIQAPARQAQRIPAFIGGRLAIGLGLAAGLLAGIGAVALLLAWRRPLVDAAGAEEATGAPVLGRVRLSSAGGPSDNPGIAPLSRRVLSARNDLVMVVSHGRDRGQRSQLAAALSSVLGGAADVRLVAGGGLGSVTQQSSAAEPGAAFDTRVGRSPRPKIVVVDGPTPEEMASRPETAMTLVAIREGTGLATAQKTADEYLDGGPGGIVLVEGRGSLKRAKA